MEKNTSFFDHKRPDISGYELIVRGLFDLVKDIENAQKDDENKSLILLNIEMRKKIIEKIEELVSYFSNTSKTTGQKRNILHALLTRLRGSL